MPEIWKKVKRFPLLEVSDQGNLRKRSTKEPYMPYESNSGYWTVTIYRPEMKRSQTVAVHSLVAETFIGPRPVGMCINHKDANKKNNWLDNLEYITHRENLIHAVKMGIQMRPGKLTKEQVIDVRETYLRYKGRAKNSVLYRAMAEQLGVKYSTIWEIVTGRSWKYVKL